MSEFTQSYRDAYLCAENAAKTENINSIHMIYGIIRCGKGISSKVLKDFGLNQTKVKKYFPIHIPLNSLNRAIVDHSMRLADNMGDELAAPEHMLFSLLSEGTDAYNMLIDMKVDPEKVKSELLRLMNTEE